MIRLTTQKIRDRIKWYHNLNEPYVIEISNHRLSLSGEGDTFMNADGMINAAELHVVKQVRYDILKHDLAKNLPKELLRKSKNPKNILYYQYSSNIVPELSIDNCVEIDLNAAYWETAHKLGLISDELYKKGESISKKTRLVAIGSLAKRKLLRAFDGKKEYTIIDKKRDTSYLWDVICYHVSTVMQEAAKQAGDDFMFFWTDALFVKKGSEKKVVKCFKKYGYTCKSYKIDNISVTDKYMIVTAKDKPVIKEVDGVKTEIFTRPFPLSKKHKNFSK